MSTQPSECNAIKENAVCNGWVPGLPQRFLEKLKTPNPYGCELTPKSTYKVAYMSMMYPVFLGSEDGEEYIDCLMNN